MDDTAHSSAQKICHAHNPTLDKLDKFVKMSFSTKWTKNISWMILRIALHRKYVMLIAQELDKLDKFVEMSFSTKWTQNIL